MNTTLRAARLEDFEWLDPLYESLMRPYVELTHSWDNRKFRQSFDPAATSIIEHNGVSIGMLKVIERPDCIYLADIQIAKEFQGRGIGSQLIQDVVDKAARRNLPVRLKVLKGNPTKALYLRLGFTEVCELDNCFELEKQP